MHNEKVTQVCNICGMRLPHTAPQAKAYHAAQVKSNDDALKRWRKEQEARLISGDYWKPQQ